MKRFLAVLALVVFGWQAALASSGSTSPFSLLYVANTWQAAQTFGSVGVSIGGKNISPVNTQTFTSGTSNWNKPAAALKDPSAVAHIQCIGGGGSGGRGAAGVGGGGGGGGGYVERWIPLSSLGATESVTVGAGGNAQTVAQNAGNAGGNTTFGSWVTAYGGGGGAGTTSGNPNSGAGGNGGSSTKAGQQGAQATGAGNGGCPLSTYDDGRYFTTCASQGAANGEGQGGGGSWTAGQGGAGGHGNFIGGGGGGGGTTNANVSGIGGNSIWGGGGGGGGSPATSAPAGGTSKYAGNGGAGAFDNNVATSGTAPGGGGGGSETANSGAGAAGRCIVDVF